MLNIRTFDLNLLRVFEALINNGSVSKAADKLGMSQPTVSNALNRLRRQLDDPLFIRSPKGMEPTPKATQLAMSVNAGLTSIRSGLLAGTEFEPAVSERHFNLLMTDVGEITFLPPLLAALNRNAPKIDINVMEASVESYGELLESGAADLAIGRIRLPDKFESQLIHTSPFVVVMGRGNRLLQKEADRKSLSYQEYLDARHIEVLPRGTSDDPIRNALGEDAVRRKIALKIPHTSVLPVIMTDTDLIATVSKVTADHLLASGTLYALPVPFEIETNLVSQWWHRRHSADLGHTWLRSIFANAGV